MGRVTGIGGIFYRSDAPGELANWYRRHLGVPVSDDGYWSFEWRQADAPDRVGHTVWSLFPSDTEYFGDERAPFMVNFRVEDLDELLATLRRNGIEVDDRLEEYDYGRFAWITDPEGNRIELWEPAGEKVEVDEHTFLLSEATWHAEGRFYGSDGRPEPATGVTTVRHRPDEWVLDGEMSVGDDGNGQHIENHYRIAPLNEAEVSTSWTSENPVLGRLQGSFTLVRETILSMYAAVDGDLRGTESLRRVTPDVYAARGALTRGGERISSWAMTLRRQGGSGRSSTGVHSESHMSPDAGGASDERR